MLMSHPQPINAHDEISHLGPRLQRGAYAVIRDESGLVLVVQTANGRCYLPGGRIEAGESPRTALVREISEECACFAAIDAQVTEAVQTIFDGDIRLEATYWHARIVERLDAEPEHQLRWLTVEEAREALHRAGDRLALDIAG